MIAFEIPGPPIGKGRPRAFRMGNSVRMHTPEKTASYESLVKLAARMAATEVRTLRCGWCRRAFDRALPWSKKIRAIR